MPSSRILAPSLLALLLACDAQPARPAPEPAVDAVKASADPIETERHYQAALELEAAGRLVEARVEVELALAGGAGRDAQLLAAKLAILRDDLDVAARLLEPLGADGRDGLVLYNLGLIAQRRGTYNSARSHYLAALKADPSFAPARYNLALLAWDAGIHDEARHHALRFIELSPGDPRGPELQARFELHPTAAPTTPATDPAVTTPDRSTAKR